MSADLPSFATTKVELNRRNSASFRLHIRTCAAVVVEGATVIPLQHGATTMLALGLLLNTVGLGVVCWLIFTLAVYILPFFVAIHASFWAYHSGAGLLGTPIVAVAAGGITLALAQLAFAMTQSLILRGLIAALFTLPATLAGYHVALTMAQFGVPSPAWQHVFACVGAIFIGSAAWTRLTVFTEPRPRDSDGAAGIGAQPVLTTAAHKQ